jgi:hypothetical protein
MDVLDRVIVVGRLGRMVGRVVDVVDRRLVVLLLLLQLLPLPLLLLLLLVLLL